MKKRKRHQTKYHGRPSHCLDLLGELPLECLVRQSA